MAKEKERYFHYTADIVEAEEIEQALNQIQVDGFSISQIVRLRDGKLLVIARNLCDNREDFLQILKDDPDVEYDLGDGDDDDE